MTSSLAQTRGPVNPAHVPNGGGHRGDIPDWATVVASGVLAMASRRPRLLDGRRSPLPQIIDCDHCGYQDLANGCRCECLDQPIATGSPDMDRAREDARDTMDAIYKVYKAAEATVDKAIRAAREAVRIAEDAETARDDAWARYWGAMEAFFDGAWNESEVL